MDAETLKQYEATLQALQIELQDELDNPDMETERVALDGSMGRLSRSDAMQVQQMALDASRRRAERLERIETALQRIRRNNYGRCGRCRNPIRPARLDAFPDAVLCVRCASTPKR